MALFRKVDPDVTEGDRTARESTILGDFGEGYCTVCRFIEPLDEAGRIVRHERGTLYERYGAPPQVCAGSWKKPPARIPVTSTKSKFGLEASVVTCPLCMTSMGRPAGVWPAHFLAAEAFGECPASGQPVSRLRPL